MTAFPKDTMDAKVAYYGDPRGPDGVNQTWYGANIVRVVPPFRMTYAGKPIKSIPFHKKCAPALKDALDDIWTACSHDQNIVEKFSLHEFGGSFNFRLIRGRNALSNHSFGIAIDIAPTGNALGVTKGKMPPFAVQAFKRNGFKWGGDYKGRKDWMHFEAVGSGVKVAAAKPVPVFAAPEIEEPDDKPVAPPLVAALDAKISTRAPEPTQSAVKGDPVIWNVQRRLKDMNHDPGGLDGAWGDMTSSAISGFLIARPNTPAAPTSPEMFREAHVEIEAELSRAEAEGYTRRVSIERATADQKKVEEIEPAAKPVNQSYFAAKWTAICGAFATMWTTFQKQVSDVWNFFFEHKDDLPSTDSGLFSTAAEWLGSIPAAFWVALGTIGVTLLAVRLFKASKDITQSVQTGARQ